MAGGARAYSSGVQAIGGATVIPHGLAGTPTEYGVALSSPSGVYFAGVSSTNVVVAAAVATGAAGNVFCSIPHTIVQ